MLMQEIGTPSDLLSVKIAAPLEMQPACNLLACDDQRVTFPRDVVDSLDRGKRRAHRGADEQHRLLIIKESFCLCPLRLDAEVVWPSGLIIDSDVQC